jgi:hypothetical protein
VEPVHLPSPRSMTDDELTAYARGYVDGWERSDVLAELDGRDAPPVDLGVSAIERGMWRNAWRQLVLAGENPTDDKIREMLWKLPKSSS